MSIANPLTFVAAGGAGGEDRRRLSPFYLPTGAPCTLASVLSQDAFDGRLFSFLFLVTFALIFIRKPVCGLP